MVLTQLMARAGLALRRDVTLGTLLERLALVHGGRRLVEEHGGGLTLTYGEAADRVARLAGGLRSRLGDGSGRPRVVIQPGNGYDVFLLCLAASRAGAIAVPVNAQATSEEVAGIASDCDAALVVHSADEVAGEPLQPAAEGTSTEVAAIFYTSGTTGRPKGAELSHRALLGWWPLGVLYPDVLRRDEVVCGLPVAHIAGFTVLILGACLGVPVYLLPRFRPTDALEAIESRRATAFVGVPAMYRMMDEAGASRRDLRSVRLWASGGDTMPPDLVTRFRQFGASATCPLIGSVGEAIFVDGYGMVELAGAAALKVSLPLVDLPMIPMPGSSLRVVDTAGADVALGRVGELAVRSPGVFAGYHGRPEACAGVMQDGWLRTGDLARRGPFGVVGLAGRVKDVIKHAGYSVFAVEVERTLERHPAVAEAAVVGIPDHRLGEVPAAAVRLRPGASADPDGLVAWAKEHLTAYKVPVRFRIVDDLPRTGPDKVRKDKVRDLFDAGGGNGR